MEKLFQGIFAALTTPFLGDDVSLSRLQANIEKYNRTGLAGYVILGSTGEAVLLSDDESERVICAAVEAASTDKMIIAGTSHESVKHTIELANRAADAGVRAVLVKPPHYYKSRMSPDALRSYYLKVAEHVRVPVLIYNFPQTCVISVDPPLIADLARHPNISGIKDSSGALANLLEVLPRVKPDFDFLIGAGSVVLPGLMMGASGGILAMAAAVPDLCVKLYGMFRDGLIEPAKKLQFDLIPLNKALTQTLGIPAIKYALDLQGFHGGLPRLPLLPLDEKGKTETAVLLKKLGVTF